MHTVGDSSSSVPAFLGKLWKLVEDPSTNHLISWNSNGVSFTIRDQARFARELLPLYYKHNNMASFVRQLNMYGFHKVVSVDSGGLKLDKDEMEFAHMYFLQGQEFLLEHIKRKIPISKQDDAKHTKPEVLTRILTEVRTMKGKQESVDSRLSTMKQENEALWREVAALRQKHMKQQQIVNKLIQFLISIVQPNGRAGLGLKRRYPLMLGEGTVLPTSLDSKNGGKSDGAKNKTDPRLKNLEGVDLSDVPKVLSSSGGPVIHDVTDILDEASNAGLMDDEDEGDVVELNDTPNQSPMEMLPEALASDLIEIPIETEATSENVPIDDELTSLEQPDFNTVIQLESGTNPSPNLLEKAMATGLASPSPLSPDLLNAIDPREINSGALLSFEEGRKSKDGRGKSVAKEHDTSMAVGEIPVLEREELDNHLDTMQVDLDQLREVLSLQGSPLDAATLLGLFSGDDTLAGSYNLSLDMDMFRSPPSGNITGNEVIAYGYQGLFDVDEQLTEATGTNSQTMLEPEGTSDKDAADLFDLLDVPQTSTSASSTKKRKKN